MALNTKAYAFKNQWLNMSLYFINFMYNTSKPFKDTLVGNFLNAYFKYTTYLTPFPFIPNPVALLYGAITQGTIQLDTNQYFNDNYQGGYDGDTQVCKYLTLINRLEDNNDQLGAGVTNSKWLANGDAISTKFIKLDKTDILLFFETVDNGFSLNKSQLNGPNNYMRYDGNSGNVTNQEQNPLLPSNNNNNNIIYFLKGKNSKDIILYSLASNAL